MIDVVMEQIWDACARFIIVEKRRIVWAIYCCLASGVLMIACSQSRQQAVALVSLRWRTGKGSNEPGVLSQTFDMMARCEGSGTALMLLTKL